MHRDQVHTMVDVGIKGRCVLILVVHFPIEKKVTGG